MVDIQALQQFLSVQVGIGGRNASAIAITTERSVFIKEIILTNPGSGYTFAPSIRILRE